MTTRVLLPSPPDPSAARYRNDQHAWMRDVHQMLLDWRGKLELFSRTSQTPAGPMYSTAFTTNTVVTGTTTGTDLSNAVSTLIQQLITASVLAPNVGRTPQ